MNKDEIRAIGLSLSSALSVMRENIRYEQEKFNLYDHYRQTMEKNREEMVELMRRGVTANHLRRKLKEVNDQILASLKIFDELIEQSRFISDPNVSIRHENAARMIVKAGDAMAQIETALLTLQILTSLSISALNANEVPKFEKDKIESEWSDQLDAWKSEELRTSMLKEFGNIYRKVVVDICSFAKIRIEPENVAPKSIKELFQIKKSDVEKRYQDFEPYAKEHPGYWIHQKLPKATRGDQKQLLILGLNFIQNLALDENEKASIAKGFLLSLKEQIYKEQQFNPFAVQSRFEKVLDSCLATPELKAISPQNAMAGFKVNVLDSGKTRTQFATKLSMNEFNEGLSSESLAKQFEKMQASVADNKWIQKQEKKWEKKL